MARRYILVDGTHGSRREDDFTNPEHHFARTLASAGCVPVSTDRRYVWDTEVDGLFGKNDVWIAAGANLYTYAVPVLCPDQRVPSDELLVIAFSHGVQVSLYAFAMGLKGTFISVNPPIRKEMIEVAKTARPNMRAWINIYGDYRDTWAILGEIGSGNFLAFKRKFAQADENVLVKGAHGAALRDPANAGIWPGLIHKVMP